MGLIRIKTRHILFAGIFLSVSLSGFTQTKNLTPEDFPPGLTKSTIQLFNNDELIEVIIATDLRTLVFDVAEERSYHPGKLYYLSDSDTIEMNVMLMTRGHFRRDRTSCTFPPFRIDFDSTGNNTIFDKMNDVKLVTHCQKRNLYENYVLQEYLIYKIYNLLTDLSFRVRLARITYVDTSGRLKTDTKFGFFIEPTGKMAKRNGGRELELKGLALNHINHPMINLFTVFQYFIANTDWSVRVLHNIKLVSLLTEPMAFPVPYDFDFCGAINTYYAAPDPVLNIRSVRNRLFRSNCRKLEELESTFEIFREKKDQIYNLYLDFPYLEEKQKRDILKYYDEFYETLDNPRAARKAFERCPKNRQP
ncbi:MAG: hypothetical protein JSV24_10985 [Bacteroidales bacterium]|nr:MAG: hypothetical protein JSV24_10985 [Bacteroidales bacterium]